MTANEFKAAVAIAKSDADLSNEDTSHMCGFGLREFKPVVVTPRQVAVMIRWQAGCLDGSWDAEAMNEVRTAGRRNFIVTE